MAKKSSPDDSEISPDVDELPALDETTPEIEVPAEVIAAFGGRPIPPPPAPRPQVSRVGESMTPLFTDPRGLLANRRPDRRTGLAKIDRARTELSGLVHQLATSIGKVRTAATAAATHAETCELEGFDPVALEALVADLEAVLSRHLS